MVETARRELQEQLRRGAPRDAVAALHSRFIDHAVVGLFHLVRFWAGIHSVVAPLTAIAVGSYGESLVLPTTSPELLLLVPEGGRERPQAELMATYLVDTLGGIGLAPTHSTKTAWECLAVAGNEPSELARLASSRHLAGAFGAWVRLREAIDEMRWD